jgi:carbonic anhydrase
MSRKVYPLGILLVPLLTWGAVRAQEAMPSSETAWKRLKDGNARFAADKTSQKKIDAKRRAELVKGQQPFAIVLCCSDSRVPPEIVFDQGLGDLFVLRLAGNIADPVVIGSIEFAVANLKTPLIVVLGHEDCGAVKVALSGDKLEGNVGKIVKLIHTGEDLPKDKAAQLLRATKNNVTYQAKRLTAESPLLKDFVASKRVQIVTGIYELESGKVRWEEEKKKK